MSIPGRAETYEQKTSVVIRLREQWTTQPKLRLGQLIVFDVEQVYVAESTDDELVRLVAEFVKEHA